MLTPHDTRLSLSLSFSLSLQNNGLTEAMTKGKGGKVNPLERVWAGIR